MPYMTPKNWPVGTYTDATWTTVVNELAILSSISISNNDPAVDIEVELRLVDTTAGNITILPPSVIGYNESYTVDLRSIAVTAGQTVEVKCAVQGINVLVSGVV